MAPAETIQQIIDVARDVVETRRKTFMCKPCVICPAATLIEAIRLSASRGENLAEWLPGTQLWLKIDYARNSSTPGSHETVTESMFHEMQLASVALGIDPGLWTGNVYTASDETRARKA